MGIAKQQVYFTKDKGPGLWQALRELKDNPIAHYGLLQARRRARRAPRWQKWLAAVIVLAVSAAASPFLSNIIQTLSNSGWYGSVQFSLISHLVLCSVITLYLAYGVWVIAGLFHTLRSASMMLSAPRTGAATTVDELVAISPLGDMEVLAGSLAMILRPLFARLALAVLLPFVGTGSVYLLGRLAMFSSHYFSQGNFYSSTVPILNAEMYSAANLWNNGQLALHAGLWMAAQALAATVILLLLHITAGRKTSNPLLASIGAALHVVFQLVWFTVLGNRFITDLLITALTVRSQFNFSILGFALAIGLVSGPIFILLLLRWLRSSLILRAGALIVPAAAPLLAFSTLVRQTLLDASWIGMLAFPPAVILPGFACLAYATGVLDQSAAPIYTALTLGNGTYTLEQHFNPAWLAKLGCQALLLPVLFMLARDAVRLYRQPGRL